MLSRARSNLKHKLNVVLREMQSMHYDYIIIKTITKYGQSTLHAEHVVFDFDVQPRAEQADGPEDGCPYL